MIVTKIKSVGISTSGFDSYRRSARQRHNHSSNSNKSNNTSCYSTNNPASRRRPKTLRAKSTKRSHRVNNTPHTTKYSKRIHGAINYTKQSATRSDRSPQAIPRSTQLHAKRSKRSITPSDHLHQAIDSNRQSTPPSGSKKRSITPSNQLHQAINTLNRKFSTFNIRRYSDFETLRSSEFQVLSSDFQICGPRTTTTASTCGFQYSW